jgi:predicted O-methyltransferase YrrM
MKNMLKIRAKQIVKKILQKLPISEKSMRKNHFLPLIDKNFKGPKGISVNEANFLYLFTKMCQPELVLETGTCCGYSTAFITAALAENRAGHCYTCEIDQDNYKNAEINFKNLGLKKWITICQGRSVEIINELIKENKISYNLDLVYLDSGTHVIIQEFELLKDHSK